MKANQIRISSNNNQHGDSRRFQPRLATMLFASIVATLFSASAQATDYYWTTTNPPASGNWDTAANWSGAASFPGSLDNAFISGTNTGGSFNITNNVTVNNIQNLTYDFISGSVQPGTAGTITTVINPGKTLSVLGSQGFYITRDAGVKAGTTHKFIGDTLTVNNAAAQVVLNSGQGVGNNTAAIIDFSALTNFNATVNVFGVANSILTGTGGGGIGAGDQVVKCTLARTNIIKATHTEADYSAANFTNAIDLFRQDNTGISSSSDAANSFFAMGVSNLFLADSVGIGRGTAIKGSTAIAFANLVPAAGSPAGSAAGYTMEFNNRSYTSYAKFRNTDGTSRMSLLDLTVNGGGTNTATTGNRVGSIMTFVGGTVDMLVDQVWLAKNYTNAFSTKLTDAGFGFDTGTVDANTVIAGYMAYTNASFCDGWLYVGTNATMRINQTLTLGYTPTNDPTGAFLASEIQTFGQVQIAGNGKLYANQINVGLVSTNNQIIDNGLLVVSNSIASSAASLTTLSMGASAQIALFVTNGITPIYVTNLLTAASSAFFNIASFDTNGISTWPVTNTLVSYKVAGTHNVSVGIKPAGATNLNMYVKDDTANNQIILITTTNVQKHLVWRGSPGNTLWDHTSPNWTNTDSGGITAFSDNDIVTFDDSAPSGNCNITIGDSVTPASILVANSVNQYVFNRNNNNIYSIGGCSLTKTGTNSLEIDSMPTSIAITVNNGLLTGSGTVNSIIVASGASMNFAGTDATSLDDSGNATLALGGVVTGAVNIQSGASFANAGTTYGAFTMGTGSTVNNSGLMTGIGSATVTTNSILNNAGTIYSLGTLTVALGGTLVDTFAGSAGQSPGSINVGTLIVNGTFKPGGNSVSTTKVTDYDYAGGSPSPLLAPNGRVQLNAGSVTVLKVDMGLAPGQTNTVLLSQNQVFGPSQNFKAFNGGTLVISNLNAIAKPFAAGQTFKLFARYTDINGDIRYPDPALNTTNAYPIIQPSTPGPGLVWDFTQLYPHGTIGVLSATDPSRIFTLTNNGSYVINNGSNIVTQLSWPADKAGGWVQVLNAALTNGLRATNWISLNGNYGNTNVGIQIMSDTNVWFITNTLVADPNAVGSATFFRFVYP